MKYIKHIDLIDKLIGYKCTDINLSNYKLNTILIDKRNDIRDIGRI